MLNSTLPVSKKKDDYLRMHSLRCLFLEGEGPEEDEVDDGATGGEMMLSSSTFTVS